MIVGVGIDLCSVERIRASEQKFGEKFAARILTEDELEHLPKHVDKQTIFLAKRFAAKEAVSKALGCGIGSKLSFLDVTVIKEDSGQPVVLFSSKVRQAFQDKLGEFRCHLSLSSEEDMAIAYAVVERVVQD